MKKRKTSGAVPVGTLGIFSAEEVLKVEQGTFWSGATKATKGNTRKPKPYKAEQYPVKTHRVNYTEQNLF